MTNPHVINNSGNNEWYTPEYILEKARKVLGNFDIDPCSNSVAQELVKADTWYSAETNGLDKTWKGRVWLNPPYSASLIKQFCNKLENEYIKNNVSGFITLTNNATETQWFKKLYEISCCFCFLTSRVKFLNSELKPANTPLQGQVICFNGDTSQKEVFVSEFSSLGLIVYK